MELAADPLAIEAPRPPFMAPIPVKQKQVNVLHTFYNLQEFILIILIIWPTRGAENLTCQILNSGQFYVIQYSPFSTSSKLVKDRFG